MSSVQKRERILEGAERVFRSKGLTGATTREIAREAGCADGTLYVHFDDRLALFLAVLERSVPGFLIPLRELEHRVGQRTVRENLKEVLHSALAFHNRIVPLVGGLLAEPELLNRYRDALRRRNLGPGRSLAAIEDYLRAEQYLGRVPKRVQPGTVAFALLGACFYRTFLKHLLGDATIPDDEEFIRGLIASLRLRVTSTPKLSTTKSRLPATPPDSEAK